jgi:hypothetical protein
VKQRRCERSRLPPCARFASADLAAPSRVAVRRAPFDYPLGLSRLDAEGRGGKPRFSAASLRLTARRLPCASRCAFHEGRSPRRTFTRVANRRTTLDRRNTLGRPDTSETSADSPPTVRLAKLPSKLPRRASRCGEVSAPSTSVARRPFDLFTWTCPKYRPMRTTAPSRPLHIIVISTHQVGAAERGRPSTPLHGRPSRRGAR